MKLKIARLYENIFVWMNCDHCRSPSIDRESGCFACADAVWFEWMQHANVAFHIECNDNSEVQKILKFFFEIKFTKLTARCFCRMWMPACGCRARHASRNDWSWAKVTTMELIGGSHLGPQIRGIDSRTLLGLAAESSNWEVHLFCTVRVCISLFLTNSGFSWPLGCSSKWLCWGDCRPDRAVQSKAERRRYSTRQCRSSPAIHRFPLQ